LVNGVSELRKLNPILAKDKTQKELYTTDSSKCRRFGFLVTSEEMTQLKQEDEVKCKKEKRIYHLTP
jgi:hypothetical protein